MREVEVKETVLFYDTDCGGVVSNIAYLRYVEKARVALFASLGMDLLSISEKRIFPVVVRTEIDYRFPARLGYEVTVTARLRSMDKVRAHCTFTLSVRGADGVAKIAAEAMQTVVLVQMPEGRPRRLPLEWLTIIE